MAFLKRVEEALQQHFESNPIIRKIRRIEPVAEKELGALTSLVLTQDPGLDLSVLKEFYPETAKPLDFIIRTVIGVEPEVVQNRFSEFARRHTELTAKQTRFLNLVQNHIVKYGIVTLDQLYDAPFTTIDSNGLDGVFNTEQQIDDLITVIETFQPQEGATA
jgi:type I restriction enzyme R subunit